MNRKRRILLSMVVVVAVSSLALAVEQTFEFRYNTVIEGSDNTDPCKGRSNPVARGGAIVQRLWV